MPARAPATSGTGGVLRGALQRVVLNVRPPTSTDATDARSGPSSADPAALGEMYARHSTAMLAFLRRRVTSPQTAEDLLHETFLRALNRLSRFEDQGHDLRPWLMTIARNLVIDHYRSGRRQGVPADVARSRQLVDAQAGPEEQAVRRLDAAVVRAALRDLPADQRNCLELRFLRGLSLRETSVLLQRNVGAVKSLQHRSLTALRDIARRDGWAA